MTTHEEGTDVEEDKTFRKADRVRVEAGRDWHAGSRGDPLVGISEQTFYRWKKVYGGLGVGELCRLKLLEVSCCRSDRHEVKLPALAARSPWG